MAHQRVFDFPPANEQSLRLNALLVSELRLVDDGTGTFSVFVNGRSVVFQTEQEAQDFFDLWTSRVENAG